MKGLLRLFFIYLVLLFLLVSSASSWARPVLEARPLLPVRTADNALLSLFRYEGGPNLSKVLLIVPGFLEGHELFANFASAAKQRGYEVLTAESRTVPGRGFDNPGELITLERMFENDFEALINRASEIAAGRELHYLGHSQGGILNVGARPEVLEKITASTLLATPTDLEDLGFLLKQSASKLLWAMNKAEFLLKGTHWFDPYGTIFSFTWKVKNSGKPGAKALATVIESSAMLVGNFFLRKLLIDAEHVGGSQMRRLWFKELKAIPLHVLKGYAEAVERGYFVDAKGNRLIRPELYSRPLQAVVATKDVFISEEGFRSRFYDKVGSSIKRLVRIESKHVTVALNDSYIQEILDFHDDPKAESGKAPVVTLRFNKCQRELMR
ncbi:MAG: hypothetical protein AB1540_01780 [Bdellovibrionota bacterium]